MLLAHAERVRRAFRVVLASGSPRRREIFTSQLAMKDVLVMPSTFPEELDKSAFDTPAAYVVENARQKAKEVLQRLLDDDDGDAAPAAASAASSTPKEDARELLVIGADTVVTLDGRILEKPGSEEEAFAMLSALSGGESQVVTGVVLLRTDGDCTEASFSTASTVRFAELSEATVRAYVASHEPYDKAGGYGYQSLASSLIKSIDGCYWNIVGFPAHDFCVHLIDFLHLQ